jgi:hypothetical protein
LHGSLPAGGRGSLKTVLVAEFERELGSPLHGRWNGYVDVARFSVKLRPRHDEISLLTSEKGNMSLMSIIIQAVIGIVIVVVVYIVSLYVLKSDSLYTDAVIDPNVKGKTAIVPGYAESSQLSYTSFNTVLPYAANFLPLNPSSNIKGGAQFSYSFWINVGNPSVALGKPILLRGDAASYSYQVVDKVANQTTSVVDRVAFCPIIEFGSNPMEFNVRFNTDNNINETLAVTQIHSSDSIYRKNLLSLFQGRWFLVTVVFEDNIPINDFENGLAVKFYVNDVMYQSGVYAAMLKQNRGNLYLFPNGSIDQCKISQMEYYNYAVGLPEVQSKYQAGPNVQPATLPASGGGGASVAGPLQLSQYNVLDIYNL